jgi:cystathionine beta-lyase/cystathionine gamma-synthase
VRHETIAALAATSSGRSVDASEPAAVGRFEAALTALEDGREALLFASTLAAVSALVAAVPAGATVVATDHSHSSCRGLLAAAVALRGGRLVLVDSTVPDQVAAAMDEATRLVWVETPTGPFLDIAEVSRIAVTARCRGALCVVDSTVATPIQQRPLLDRADIVFHATTSFLTGDPEDHHAALVFAESGVTATAVAAARAEERTAPGARAAEQACLGLATLPLRARAASETAAAVASYLIGHAGVAAVYYPGLPAHRGHAVARTQMKGFGPRLGLRLAGGAAAAERLLARVELLSPTAVAGGPRSRVERLAAGPGPTAEGDLVRLTIGLEAAGDLVADLDQALAG